MTSLTSILPQIAPTLGLTKDALYERQRALVRLGLLPTPQGRGRGSGAEATPDTVALLIIACLATDNLSDTDGRVQKLASAPFGDKRKDRCPWTGKSTFKDALSYLLSAEAPEGVGFHTSITVSRWEPSANIFFVWKRRPGKGLSQFGQPDKITRERLSTKTEFPHAALQTIRKAIRIADLAGDPK